jgi:hypothetical protein
MSNVAAFDYQPIDPEPTDAELLGTEITELSTYIYAATCQLLELIRKFDEKRYWEDQGFQSCVQWLNFHCGLGPNAARERLRVAHALENLPKIRERFSNGQLSFSKVRAMTRVASPENEDFLLTVAKHGNASHVERLVSQYRRVEKLRHPEAVSDAYLSREVTYYYDEHGCLVMKAKMPADQGELVVKALEKAMEEHYTAARSADPDEAHAAGDEDILEDERPPVAARRADALREVAETYLNDAENSGSTADRYQVVVHTRARLAGDPIGAYLENGPHVSVETSKRISCDCCKTTIEEDESGEPLSIKRRSRTIPPAIRRALKARDGDCRFPGCSSHKFCDGHHIKHWADGGETSLDNLVLLCRHHHHLVHEGGFDCRKSKDGEIYFVDRRAQRLQEFTEAEPVSIEETLAWMYRNFNGKDVRGDDVPLRPTCQAEWYAGEQLDMEHAVWVMWQAANGRNESGSSRSNDELSGRLNSWY